MRKLRILPLLLIAFFGSASVASAQACLGLPSFANGALHLNAAAEFADSVEAYAVGIGLGKPNSLFGNLGASQVTFEGLDGKATSGFLEFGFQIPLGKAQLCPIAGGSFGVGPDDDLAGIKVKSNAASGGIALGLPLGGKAFRVIPNAAVRYEYLSQKVEETGAGSFTDTFGYGVVDLGFAFVFGDRLSVQPITHFPFGDDDTDVSFGVFASISFGPKAK